MTQIRAQSKNFSNQSESKRSWSVIRLTDEGRAVMRAEPISWNEVSSDRERNNSENVVESAQIVA